MCHLYKSCRALTFDDVVFQHQKATPFGYTGLIGLYRRGVVGGTTWRCFMDATKADLNRHTKSVPLFREWCQLLYHVRVGYLLRDGQASLYGALT